MWKQVSLSDQTVARLKQLAEPLEDSYDSVIGRLLDYFETREDMRPAAMTVELDSSARKFDPFTPPNLTHTKLTAANVSGTPLVNPNWNGLLDTILRRGFVAYGSFDALNALTPVNMIAGRKTNEGYHFLPDVGFSVQGQDANDAWKYSALLALMLDCNVQAQFVWRLKDGAAFPGVSGRFEIVGGAQ